MSTRCQTCQARLCEDEAIYHGDGCYCGACAPADAKVELLTSRVDDLEERLRVLESGQRDSEQPDRHGESVEMWRNYVSEWFSMIERALMTGGYKVEEDRDRLHALLVELRDKMVSELEAVI